MSKHIVTGSVVTPEAPLDVNIVSGDLGIEETEDSAHVSGDKGIMPLGVRNDAVVPLSSHNFDYTPIGVTSTGAVMINDGGGSISIDALALPLPAGAATAANQLPDGHEVEVNNFPAEYPLPDAQVATLTPPAEYPLPAAQITTLTPPAEYPLPAGQLATLTPPAAITGFAIDDNQQPPATTPTVYNITLTVANTEYSQALPANTKDLRFRCRTLYDVRFAWVTGKVATPTAPYLTLSAGCDYCSDGNNLASQALFLASATAGVVVELECWS